MIRHSPTELESLIAIAASVAGAHRLEDVLEVAATRARDAMGVATLSISRWEIEHGRLRTLINSGEAEDLWPTTSSTRSTTSRPRSPSCAPDARTSR